MVQRAQIIDVTRSYYPCDPNSFVQNLINTDREDGEEKPIPVLPYEGYNFLPTAYGYRSYFGVADHLTIGALPSRAQFVLSYQLPNYKSWLIALCEDGIWICDATTADATWSQQVTFYLEADLPNPEDPSYDPFILEEWSYCIIENILYMYQQGRATAWKTDVTAPVLTIVTHTPSALNMEGQMGIFKAGLRLGFWDSANSVSWSSNFDLTDFSPAIENLAGATIFGDVIGRIVTVKGHGEGFIIYCTKAIVGVSLDITGNLLWDSKKIFDNIGIVWSKQVTYGQSDSEHFVWSTNGFYRIGKYNTLAGKHEVEVLVPDFYDFLKESRDPISLDTINSRYIFVNVMNAEYLWGLSSYTQFKSEDLKTQFLLGTEPWDGTDLPAIDLNCVQAANVLKQLVTFGFKVTDDTSALWTLLVSETQENTNGPLDMGINPRDAQTPGFTVEDMESYYLEAGTLPAELNPTPFEHGIDVILHLGNIPQGSVTFENSMGESVLRVMYKQLVDWELFRQHQAASVAILSTASKVTTIAGTTLFYSSANVPLPALPTSSYVDEEIGSFRTGNGNIEMQKDVPLRMLHLRKYFQEKRTVTKRVVTSYVWRLSSSSISLYQYYAPFAVMGKYNNTIAPDFTMTFGAVTYQGGDYNARLNTALNTLLHSGALSSQIPPTCENTLEGLHTLPLDLAASSFYLGIDQYMYMKYTRYSTGLPMACYRFNQGQYVTNTVTGSSYYQDTIETITYIVSEPETSDEGYDELKAIQIAYGKTLIQVTSDPPTIVAHSLTPIFPTGDSAVTFFPPAWDGVETLKIMAASAYPPWHLSDGSFGIEADFGDAIVGTEGYPAGETCEIDSVGHYPGTEFGITYSSFPYVLQTGSPVPLYPAYEGSYVLDLSLKKWGKMRNAFQTLVDYQAVNQFNSELISADDKGMTAGLKGVNNELYIFDDAPVDGYLVWGKIGGYRLGMTNLLEVKAQFRRAATGLLTVDSSMDGRSVDSSLNFSTTFTDALVCEALPDISARWHIVKISGTWDLTGLEARATIVSRR